MSRYIRKELTGSLSPVNSELEKIQQVLDSKLDKSPDAGQANQMAADLDMNGKAVVNAAVTSDPKSLVTREGVEDLIPVKSVNGQTGDVVLTFVGGNGESGTDQTLTQDLINLAQDVSVGTIVRTAGFFAFSDQGSGVWRATNSTGNPPSQTPIQRGREELTDATGRLWRLKVENGGINVAQLGATTADIGPAANAAFNWMRAQLQNSIANIPAMVTFPQGVWDVLTPINVTGLGGRGWHVHMKGCLLVGKTVGKPVIDALGSRFGNWYGLNIFGDQTLKPKSGIQIGQLTGAPADCHYFERPTITGWFSLASLHNNGSETCTFVAPFLINKDTSNNSYCLIQDGRHQFNVESDYATVTFPQGSPSSFNENTFYSLDARKDSGGPAIYMMRTTRHKFYNSYVVSVDNAGFVLDTDEVAHRELYINAHFETSNAAFTGLQDCVFITGVASPRFEGFFFEDHDPHAANSIIRADTGVSPTFVESEIRLAGFNVIPTNGILHPAASFSYNGKIYTRQPSVLRQYGRFNGELTVNTLTGTTFGPGTVKIIDTSTTAEVVKGTTTFVSDGPSAVADVTTADSVTIASGKVIMRGASAGLDFPSQNVSTTASAGAAQALGTPVGYLTIEVSGVPRKIPFYGV